MKFRTAHILSGLHILTFRVKFTDRAFPHTTTIHRCKASEEKFMTTKPTNDGVIRWQEPDVIQIDAATIPIIKFNTNKMQI
jgi:hypothetical protein